MSTMNVPQHAPTKPPVNNNLKPNRLPAPTLFVGPPSRNASQLSLRKLPSNVEDPRHNKQDRGKSGLGREVTDNNNNNTNDSSSPDTATKAGGSPQDASAAAGAGLRTTRTRLTKPSEKSLDARWREMQSTLNEVELTAQSTTHVFGASHAAALDELRRAQIALARAWGRGNDDQKEAEGAAAAAGGPAELNMDRFQGADDLSSERRATRRRAATDASASTTLSDESALSSEAPGGGGSRRSARSQLEEETAQDIKLGGERRAANEAYFKKVDAGVKDVVAKLEAVAEAMRGVEGESRSLFGSASTDSSNEDTGPKNERDK